MKSTTLQLFLCVLFINWLPSQSLALKGGAQVSQYSPYPFWKHTVQIRFNEDLCTGFIVSERHIATAGHCRQDYTMFTLNFSVPTKGAGNEIRHEIALPLEQFRSLQHTIAISDYEKMFGFQRSQTPPPTPPVLHQEATTFFASSDSVLEVFPESGEEYLYDISYSLTDFAIIELPEGVHLPEGFAPVEFFSFSDFLQNHDIQALSDLTFFAVGYGEQSYHEETHHRDQELSFLPQKLEAFGRINHEIALQQNIANLGILFFGGLTPQEGSLCFEDSGGPLFVVDEGRLLLAGVGIFEVNSCKFGGFTPISNLQPWLQSSFGL